MNRSRLDGTYPLARLDELVVTESGNELLVYDTRTYALHHLNPLASIIWRACDGTNYVEAIQAICSEKLVGMVSEQEVEDGLQQLTDQDLMLGMPQTSGLPRGRSSRRKVIKRTTMMGAAIASVTVPLGAAHASRGTVGCVPDFGACSVAQDCCHPQIGCGGRPSTCGG